jgi:3-deoxy-D-manno-octulosonic-acid transferase
MRPAPERIPDYLGRMLIELLGASWSIDYLRPRTGRTGRVRAGNVLYAFWHSRQLPLIYTHRHEGITVMVSRHRDGQYVADVLHVNGFGTVRGSTTRGGLGAFRGMARVLRSGLDGAITPDGPRGPAEVMKPGAAHIAALARRPLVCMGTSAWPSLKFRSWDRFVLPLPFARVSVVEGRPMSMDPADPEGQMDRVEAEIRRVTAAADLTALPRPRFQAFCLGLLARCLSPLVRAALTLRPREERRERTGMAGPRCDAPVWLHGSSLGELKGLLPVARMLTEEGVPVHTSCCTPAGRELLRNEGIPSSFMPLEVPGWVDRYLSRIRPRALVLSETEIWPNMLMHTIRRGIPVAMVNARLSERSLRRYSPIRRLLGAMLSSFVGILARTREDMERFALLGVDERALRVGGDTKALYAPGEPPPGWTAMADARRPVMVAGSTREGEEETVSRAALENGVFAVIAPRHLHRAGRVASLLEDMGMRPALWSTMDPRSPDPGGAGSVVVDVHGVLDRLYGIADVAFVGGTLVDMGGHNIMEPLHHGVPLVVGSSVESYAALVSAGSGAGTIRVVSDAESMSSALSELIESPPGAEEVRHLVRKESDRVLGNVRHLLHVAFANPGG